ncbi:HAAS signaling domain-containing protein [Paenibacillus senegalensis]|uniref:HAAS signaling domain-containing protein n=1 Tax=Paenibacillus senegalensis TaxID=1465766 RepID=UPI0002897CD5|nr:DUF1700 domain-containing protein [Paenibacillus senegalensis]
MLKDEFFRDLELKLKALPAYEREQILRVYEDLFNKAAENGKDEREVAESLGYRPSPNPISFKPTLAAEAHEAPLENTPRNLFAAVALALFNLIFVLPPVLAVAIVLMLLASGSLLIIAVSVLIWFFPILPLAELPHFFLSLLLFGFGLLCAVSSAFLVKFCIVILAKYIRINVNLIRGQ